MGSTYDITEEPILSRKSLARVWQGRRRYFDAIKTVYKIDRSYKQVRKRVAHLDSWKERRPYYKAAHPQNAEMLYELCKRNGATWVKVAQFMSARPDLLPREYIHALARLQNDAHPVPFHELTPVMEDELGANWRDHFEWVSEEPTATASIGQVHKAQLKDGREVAIKVQLPAVKRLFMQDFNLFRMLAEVLKSRLPQIDLKQMVNQLLRMTAEELDFRIEAANLKEFAALKHHPRIRIPTLVEELSRERVIVTEWINGTRLVEHLDRSNKEEARDLLSVVQDSYMQQITRFGVYQADPHPGNFMVDPDKNIFILDYGVIGHLTPKETVNYTRLLMRMLGHSKEDLGKIMTDAGFLGVEADKIEEMSQYFIRTKRPEKKVRVDEVIEELMETFQEYRITVPDSFVGMGRVVMTIGGLMQIYRVPFNWIPSPVSKAS
ncbi:MAG: AarF/UbiB family protein [Pseudomonadota bacterium]|nr:AarF/UbiB family protein [Pseudomonadota bacterium]HJO34585.1 AarF/UbiB family protein [Gammaproteobacteria bacterium]